jgi:hypothetical protein
MAGIENFAQRVAEIFMDNGRLAETQQLVGYSKVAVEVALRVADAHSR